MIAWVVVLGLLQQTPTPVGAIGRVDTPPRKDDSTVVLARDQPDSIRARIPRLFARVVAAPPDSAERILGEAERLAQAYRSAWGDPFLVRRVEQFRAWSPDERRVKVEADSLRLQGNAAFGRSGPEAAMRVWRRSVDLCHRLGDSVCVAQGLGNLGRGFYAQGALDSATSYYTRSREYAEGQGDSRTAGNAVGALAAISADQGQLRRAAELYRQANEWRVKTGDDRGIGGAADENNRGLIAQTLGDIPAAREAFTRALQSNLRGGRRTQAAANLINLGNVAALTGSLDSAAALYREALSLYHVEDDRVGEAEVLRNLGLLALRDGDYRTAVARLSEALAIYRVTGPAIDATGVRRDLASARAAMGDLQGALIELDRADRAASAPGTGVALRARVALARADLALQFNRPDDAARDYPRAEALFHEAGDLNGQAAARQGLGFLQLLKEDYAKAAEALQVAARLQGESGDHRSAAISRLSLAYALGRQGDSSAARGLLEQARDSLQAVGDDVGVAAAFWGLGELAVAGGRAAAAESLYRQGLGSLQDRPAPSVSWQLHAGLAEVLDQQGERDAAVGELKTAAGLIELVASHVVAEPLRISYLADKTEVYSQLARIQFTAGRSDQAFAASERLRAREMLDLLGRGRIAFGTSPGDSLAARAQSLRRQIADLTSQVENPNPEGGLRERPTAPSAVAREALVQAQDAYADLLLRMEEGGGKGTGPALVGGSVATVREVMGKLAPGEALLEYLVADSTTMVFAVTADTFVTIDLGVGRHDLAALVDFTRGLLSPTSVRQRGGDELWRTPLRRLYRELIAPVEATGLLTGKHVLFIVPHAELHYLPFAALIASEGPAEHYLVERYAIETVPSASVWLRLRARATRSAGDGTVLALAPRVDALPGSRAEVETIRETYGARATVLTGVRASEAVFRADAGQAEVIHLATFGVLNKHNPLFSFVELAPHGSDDGRLEVHEVFGLGLHARLVVLSACQTALGSGALADVPAGDDWVGLVQAFLYAGAGTVMASLWPVEDRATADLMSRFYKNLNSGAGEAEALAEAQQQALRNRTTAEPFYWAGFTLSGGQ